MGVSGGGLHSVSKTVPVPCAGRSSLRAVGVARVEVRGHKVHGCAQASRASHEVPHVHRLHRRRPADSQRGMGSLHALSRCPVQLEIWMRVVNTPHLIPNLETPGRHLRQTVPLDEVGGQPPDERGPPREVARGGGDALVAPGRAERVWTVFVFPPLDGAVGEGPGHEAQLHNRADTEIDEIVVHEIHVVEVVLVVFAFRPIACDNAHIIVERPVEPQARQPELAHC
mmetsp:Transcript_34239/g.63493  ORF Transcript_34239/g.63493 Transcript_34239/m.63493 type:complete len:227 (+) Transcript_34239:897-1577(+)